MANGNARLAFGFALGARFAFGLGWALCLPRRTIELLLAGMPCRSRMNSDCESWRSTARANRAMGQPKMATDKRCSRCCGALMNPVAFLILTPKSSERIAPYSSAKPIASSACRMFLSIGGVHVRAQARGITKFGMELITSHPTKRRQPRYYKTPRPRNLKTLAKLGALDCGTGNVMQIKPNLQLVSQFNSYFFNFNVGGLT